MSNSEPDYFELVFEYYKLLREDLYNNIRRFDICLGIYVSALFILTVSKQDVKYQFFAYTPIAFLAILALGLWYLNNICFLSRYLRNLETSMKKIRSDSPILCETNLISKRGLSYIWDTLFFLLALVAIGILAYVLIIIRAYYQYSSPSAITSHFWHKWFWIYLISTLFVFFSFLYTWTLGRKKIPEITLCTDARNEVEKQGA